MLLNTFFFLEGTAHCQCFILVRMAEASKMWVASPLFQDSTEIRTGIKQLITYIHTYIRKLPIKNIYSHKKFRDPALKFGRVKIWRIKAPDKFKFGGLNREIFWRENTQDWPDKGDRFGGKMTPGNYPRSQSGSRNL